MRVPERVRERERALGVLERPLLVAVVRPELPQLALDRDGEPEVPLRLEQCLLAALDRLSVVVESHDGQAKQTLGSFTARPEFSVELLEQLAGALDGRCFPPG